jgi:SAM-dependent methyltransferase
MTWAEEFYRSQLAWMGIYSGEPDDEHREKVTTIERMAGPGPRRILELGPGGGQNAAAAADLGHSVVGVELVPELAAHAGALAASRPGMRVINASFYDVELDGPFDLVLYWDGFGVGEDADQGRLLRRIAGWLAPGGCALIDINTPWYWAAADGVEMRWESAARRYGFDPDGCRMLDTWWPADDETRAVSQSLRCYSPADLRLLLAGSGLALDGLEPGGAVSYEDFSWEPRVELGRAMQYTARLVREGG